MTVAALSQLSASTPTSPATADTPLKIKYSPELEQEISRLAEIICHTPPLAQYQPRWLAIQLLEGDEPLLAELHQTPDSAPLRAALAEAQARLTAQYGEDVDIILADYRYSFVNRLVHSVLTRPADAPANFSDRLDKIVTHRWLGIPIFLLLMWVVFKVTTDVATPFLDWVDYVINGPLTRWSVNLLGLMGLGGSWLESLLVDGILAGVGGLMVFVPVLMALYTALAILEDSGYMARAAFVMDHLMQKVGLHGKSFLPMVVGFGCSVPGLYATRTLENEKDRILTGLLVPFMSCGARLPVYVLFAAIFFPAYTGLVIFGLYLTGILIAIGLGLLLRRTLFSSTEETHFLIELPPYRRPNVKTVWFYVWERTLAFLKNAWTLILATSIVIWFLMATPVNNNGSFADTALDDSLFGVVAGVITPIFEPLGFGSWENSGALVSGLVAKEVIISTIGQVHQISAEAADGATAGSFAADVAGIVSRFGQAVVDTVKSIPLIVGIDLFGEEEEPQPTALMQAVRTDFETTSGGHGGLAALSFLVFVLLYTPCMVTIAAERQELGMRWTWLSIFGQFGIAWLAAFVVFQGGKLLL